MLNIYVRLIFGFYARCSGRKRHSHDVYDDDGEVTRWRDDDDGAHAAEFNLIKKEETQTPKTYAKHIRPNRIR